MYNVRRAVTKQSAVVKDSYYRVFAILHAPSTVHYEVLSIIKLNYSCKILKVYFVVYNHCFLHMRIHKIQPVVMNQSATSANW